MKLPKKKDIKLGLKMIGFIAVFTFLWLYMVKIMAGVIFAFQEFTVVFSGLAIYLAIRDILTEIRLNRLEAEYKTFVIEGRDRPDDKPITGYFQAKYKCDALRRAKVMFKKKHYKIWELK